MRWVAGLPRVSRVTIVSEAARVFPLCVSTSYRLRWKCARGFATTNTAVQQYTAVLTNIAVQQY